MSTNRHDQHEDSGRTQPSGLLFRGQLIKRILKALPGHFFLLSNIGDSPSLPALECEGTESMSREELWRLMVTRQLDGGTFDVFADKQSLQIQKDERLKIPWGSSTVQ